MPITRRVLLKRRESAWTMRVGWMRMEWEWIERLGRKALRRMVLAWVEN